MTSAMCNAQLHENCGEVMRRPEGKKFRCDCDCHKPVKKWEEFDESELEGVEPELR